MMSIFGSPFCYTPVAPEPSFTPLLRLLDEFDWYTREAERQPRQRPQQVQRRTPTFKPKFDARETEDAYELLGELPGIERENLNLEFTDPQTLVVRGRVVRTYENKPTVESQKPEQADEADPEKAPANNNNNHHATVEDDTEDETISIISASSASPATPAETPKTEVAKPAQATPPAPAPAPAEKVWMYERSVGEFSRTFHFPGRVDQDAVSATLDNGVLSVVVPKAKKPATRRIMIN